MYITVHRLRSNARPRGVSLSGFNAFAYLHGEQPIPKSLSIDDVAEKAPGELVEQSIEVPPGGNFVDSYLDVVAPDSTTASSLEKTLEQLRLEISESATEIAQTWELPAANIRLYVSRRVPTRSARSELEQLARRVVAIRPGTPRRDVTIRQTFDGRHYRFHLEEPDDQRPDLIVTSDVHDNFETTGSRFVDILPSMLLMDEELAELPAIRILNAEDECIWTNRP